MTGFVAANRVRRISASPSTAAAALLRELKAQGRDVVDLTVGEPDFDTTADVKDAAISAIRAGQTKYTPVNGTLALRQAIATKLAGTGRHYAVDEITVGGGAKQVIYLSLMASINHGDEVIVPSPCWVSYPDMVRANGGRAILVSCPEANGFKLTPGQLATAITERTRWLVLNSPGNPTGAAYRPDELRALADVLLAHPRVWVLCDEIYDEISYLGARMASLATVEPRLRERTVVVNGVSKTYAMTGWRIGWCAGPRPLIDAINTLQSQISSCPSSISQAAAVAAIEGDQAYLAERLSAYRRRRDHAVRVLNDIPGISCRAPDGAFYLFPGCAALIGTVTPGGTVIETDEDLTRYLLEQVGVGVIHGGAYGCSPHFRISFATPDQVLADGCGRIAQAVKMLKRP